MDPVLETLPDHPLTVEDVANLNDAPSLRVIPYTWYGEQVIAILLLYDERATDLESGVSTDAADGTYTESADSGAGEFEENSGDGSPATDTHATQVELIDATGEESDESESTRESETTEFAGGDSGTDTDADADGESSAFGSRDSERVGTVEVVGADGADAGAEPAESEQLTPAGESDDAESVESHPDGTSSDQSDDDPSLKDSDIEHEEVETDLQVYAAGYDDAQQAWVVAGQVDPDAEFTDAEPIIREWLADSYADGIVSRLAVGPAEYELGGGGEN